MSKPKKTVEVVNYYDRWSSADDADDIHHYPNEEALGIKLPFRGILQGASGSGKTNIAMNLISLIGIWDKVVILAKNLEEKLYREAIKYIKKVEIAQKRRILLAIDDIADLPPLDAFTIQENSLLIVDDFVAEDPKSLKPLSEIWLRGRKNGISPLFISQSYFDTPKIIRKNSDYVFMKSIGNPKDLMRIAAEYAMGATAKEIKEKYEQVDTTDITKFFMIDRNNKDPHYQFRNGFEPMY